MAALMSYAGSDFSGRIPARATGMPSPGLGSGPHPLSNVPFSRFNCSVVSTVSVSTQQYSETTSSRGNQSWFLSCAIKNLYC